MWDYAEMSKAAKDAGGPDIFMEGLVEEGLKSGRVQGVIATLAVVAVSYTGKLIFDKVSKPSGKATKIVDRYMRQSLHSKTHDKTQSKKLKMCQDNNENSTGEVDDKD